jgi:class 3 adenylate cyclase
VARDEHVKGSESRLWSLIEARTQPGADKAAIDQRIWDLFGEEWAVMMTDLAGFSRQVVAFGIIHFLQVIHEQKRELLPIVASHDGVLIKVEADSFLILFKRVSRAVACAVEMQHRCERLNETRKPEEQILLCVGIGHGRILRIGDIDVFGAEVNAASKLGEDIAKAREILVSEAARDALGESAGFTFEPLDVQVPGTRAAYRLGY